MFRRHVSRFSFPPTSVGVDVRILQDHVHEAFCAFSILHKVESLGEFSLENPFWNINIICFAGLSRKFMIVYGF